MCSYEYVQYQCGCKKPREFSQCSRLYKRNEKTRCDEPKIYVVDSRNRCPKHLMSESSFLEKFYNLAVIPRKKQRRIQFVEDPALVKFVERDIVREHHHRHCY
ncbi:unnamed protein product [Clonostachys rosea f. rosea IK726]|jgi:hypothetical protein|uniref:Uncharacterized protein n=2 Tax=Bionectria ochroleuca TaxID=29856 RepID=A0A8H7TMB8_BIOOC|nr:unnamed protein product [Clonostachys rosea f. rosea IK726]